jgi:hypothetical protein
MNRLVEYLEKHHNPNGNAINHVRVDDLLPETEWTIAEVYEMSLEAREAGLVTMTMKTGYRVGDNDPEGLDLIGIWHEVYKKMGIKG